MSPNMLLLTFVAVISSSLILQAASRAIPAIQPSIYYEDSDNEDSCDTELYANSTQEDPEDRFSIDEPDINSEHERAILSRLVDGPLSRSQAIEVTTRMLELLSLKRKKNKRPCRVNPTVDQAARNLVKFMTQESIGGSSDGSEELDSHDTNERDSDYCELYSFGDENRSQASIEQMKKIVALADSGASEKTIKSKYRWYDRRKLDGYRKCLEIGEIDLNRARMINSYVLARVREARNKRQPVHDYMIQNWGRQRAFEVNATHFKGSPTWIKAFKRRNRISSRKITKYSSLSEQEQELERQDRIRTFRRTYETNDQYFPRRLIWNTDQTGFNYEIANERTLTFIGERDVIIDVNSKNKISHSYTAMPTISRDGRIIGKLLLCMQEPSGDFGPIVRVRVRELERVYGNIILIASKSGKMSKESMQDWMHQILIPAVASNNISFDGANDTRSIGTVSVDDNAYSEDFRADGEDVVCYEENYREIFERCNAVNFEESRAYQEERCRNDAISMATRECTRRPSALLLIDSWSGQTGRAMQHDLRNRGNKVLFIPPRTTDELQPLDVNFIRQYKKFVKRITERTIYENSLANVTSREGIINLHSLIWNQFHAAAYQDMIRYAWRNTDPLFTSQELAMGPPPRMVQDVQFAFNRTVKCGHQGCNKYAFMRCSHCGKSLCLEHFLARVCFHDEEINSGAGPSGVTTRPDLPFDHDDSDYD